MQPRDFNGHFYVKDAPGIAFDAEDGMFTVWYDVGKVRIEFVMRPSIYLKALRLAERAAKRFNERDAGVSSIGGQATH